MPSRSRQRGELIGIVSVVGLLHVIGWGGLFAALRQHFGYGVAAFGSGTGLTAYMLGVRHAFDADHIAAIDNTTRKLMQQGQRPLSIGLWFASGHSTAVFALTAALAAGMHAAGPVLEAGSNLHRLFGLLGTVVSSGFLYVVAALNIAVLLEVRQGLRRMRAGQLADRESDIPYRGRGLFSRVLRWAAALVHEPWQMWVIGLLFGLGFDTATEIAVLTLTGSGVVSGLPWYAVFCVPTLFAAGMALADTLDGSFMVLAYGWALTDRLNSIRYNLAVTGISVVAALGVGTVQLLSLLSDRLDLQGTLWASIRTIDVNSVGLTIVALFLATWLAAAALRGWGRTRSVTADSSLV
jgi:high-affinity nickel-transport protein